MNYFYELFRALVHLDSTLINLVTSYGPYAYLMLFLIVFAETGLVFTAFLPGDSLLFTAGSLAAQPDEPLKISWLFILLFSASITGNQINYSIGRFIGPQVFKAKNSWLLNQKHLKTSHDFYARHGGKTLILARFLPIIRSFAPFIAGIGTMNTVLFTGFNLLGGFLWVGLMLGLGYFLGSLPLIKQHFSVIIYGIILISLLPPLLAMLKNK